MKALIVVSTWCPAMLADMHRVRLLAGELREQGWEVELLSPDASFQRSFAMEPYAERFFPDVPVHYVGTWQPWLFKILGAGTIGWRAIVPVNRMGRELLRTRGFDVVYFSTTTHLLTCLGPHWRRSFRVPYVADVHDPVYLPKRRHATTQRRFKLWVADRLSRRIEAMALGRADGLVSVSRGYVEELQSRYPLAPWNAKGRVLVQPFAADLAGLELISAPEPAASRRRVVYVGAGGTIMERGWKTLVDLLKNTPEALQVGFEIYGTAGSWRPGQQGHLEKVAEAQGLAGVVAEKPARIPYADSLALIKGADGLVVLGVDDPNYQPSKLHTYLASGLPVLVLARAESDLASFAQQAGPGVYGLKFGEGSDRVANLGAVRAFLADVQAVRRFSIGQRSVLDPRRAAAEHAELLLRVAKDHRSRMDVGLEGRKT
jgi:hypothetical protein